jgi:hypothetical protein
MPTPTFTCSPRVDFGVTPDRPTIIFRYAGTATEQRATLTDVEREIYRWGLEEEDATMRTIRDFFQARGQAKEAFYIRDPDWAAQTGVPLGTATSGQTVFTLPTTGTYSRDYPIGAATFTVKDDGVATGTTVTVDDDARTFTLDTAPASNSVMTADYITWRKVRLVSFSIQGSTPTVKTASLEMREVPG